MATVLITGANRGLGLNLTKHYLSNDHHVHACCRHPDQASELKVLLAIYPEQLTVSKLDIASQESIKHLKNQLGATPIDILINNAGIYQFNILTDHLDMQVWDLFFHTNSVGPYLLSQALLENVQNGTEKKIINVSSSLGSITLNDDGSNLPYRASKAALNAITKSLALLNKRNEFIIVALHPGWVKTDMGGPNAQLTPQESVSSMTRLIDKLTAQNSGKYYAYDGEELPW